ncbi:MAG: ABC transporter ATP-binding protein, partial [Candidatus Bathyarchaeia archaeon]
MADNTTIRLSHVEKYYNYNGKNIRVLDDVSISINQGEFVALVGPTGCGKTTLVNLITGLDKPVSGEISVEDTDIVGLDEDELARFRARKIGLVFQSQNLLQESTVQENVELPLFLVNMKENARENRVQEALKIAGVHTFSKRKIGTLSVGEKQTVAFARALVTNPDILIMDEPSESLDPLAADTLLAQLRGRTIMQSKTVLITTHNRRFAEAADRIINVKKRMP